MTESRGAQVEAPARAYDARAGAYARKDGGGSPPRSHGRGAATALVSRTSSEGLLCTSPTGHAGLGRGPGRQRVAGATGGRYPRATRARTVRQHETVHAVWTHANATSRLAARCRSRAGIGAYAQPQLGAVARAPGRRARETGNGDKQRNSRGRVAQRRCVRSCGARGSLRLLVGMALLPPSNGSGRVLPDRSTEGLSGSESTAQDGHGATREVPGREADVRPTHTTVWFER